MKPNQPTNTHTTTTAATTITLTLTLLLTACTPNPDNQTNNNQLPPNTTATPNDNTDPIQIQPHYQPGNRYTFQIDITFLNDLSDIMPGGGEQKMQQTQTFSITALKKQPNNNTLLEHQSLRIKQNMQMGELNMNYDTDNPQNTDTDNPAIAAMAIIFQTLINHPIQLELDPNLNFTNITGADELQNKLTQALPDEFQQFTQMFNTADLFNPDTLQQSMTPIKTDQPVKPGDTWNETTTLNFSNLGNFNVNLQYHFKHYETLNDKNTARIDFTGNITGNTDIKAGPIGIKSQITDGKMSGTQWFDPQSKQFIHSSNTQNLTMKIDMAGIPENALPENENNQLTFNMTITQTQKLLSIQPTEQTTQ